MKLTVDLSRVDEPGAPYVIEISTSGPDAPGIPMYARQGIAPQVVASAGDNGMRYLHHAIGATMAILLKELEQEGGREVEGMFHAPEFEPDPGPEAL